jgi:uncharacterized membrane protein YqhA
MVELSHLVGNRFFSSKHISETDVMLVVLGLIDVVMIANLLIMVIIGGYETFVSASTSRPPRPAGMALACQCRRAQDQAIDGDHRHFVDPPAEDLHQCQNMNEHTIKWQVIIHAVFLVSAAAMAWVDRMMTQTLATAAGQTRCRQTH